jgi:hypothetical protein
VGKYDEYRVAALDCVALADASRDPHSRTVLLKMAQMWAHLADQAEQPKRHHLRDAAAAQLRERPPRL